MPPFLKSEIVFHAAPDPAISALGRELWWIAVMFCERKIRPFATIFLPVRFFHNAGTICVHLITHL
jgi:hypothetical protein